AGRRPRGVVVRTSTRCSPPWWSSLRSERPMNTEARGYSWPPFEPGHTITVKHGAKAERFVQPVADELAVWLAAVAPWTAQPAFRASVAAWSYSEAQATLLRSYVDAHGVLDDAGVPLPAVALLDRVETRAGRLRSELGLTPSSWAK